MSEVSKIVELTKCEADDMLRQVCIRRATLGLGWPPCV
jgi:hypothetical protein